MDAQLVVVTGERVDTRALSLRERLLQQARELGATAAQADSVEAASQQVRAAEALGRPSVVVLGPCVEHPARLARRLSAQHPELRYVFALDPGREQAVRRELLFSAPPGGRWTALAADSPALAEHLDQALAACAQQQRSRTTLERLRLRLAGRPPLSSAEHRRLVVSDHYLAGVLACAHDAIVSLDLSGAIVSCNAAAERLFKLEHLEAEGLDLASLFDVPASLQLTLQAATRGSPTRGEFVLDEARGARVVATAFTAFRDERDQILGVVAILRDITLQREAEARSRELNERLVTTLESITDGLYTLDRDWRFTYVNRRAEELLRRDRASLLGRSIWEEFAPALGSAFEAEYRRACREQRASTFRAFYAPLDGWFEMTAYPSEQGLAVYFRDVTEALQIEQAQRAQLAAEAASRTKSQFLSRLSHEMRTPLNAVLGFAQLLALHAGDPEGLDARSQLSYANQIRRAGLHLLALVNDVLDIQQVEEGRLSLSPEPIELAEAVDTTTELLLPLAEAHRVATFNEVPPGVAVVADRVRLRQVMINLGGNAVKYNHEGGTVRWQLARDPARADRATLCVVDSGPGMSAEQLGRLFQPFERLGKETGDIEGTGLGLFVSRGIVEQMGGSLRIESEPGRGTRALVELPLWSGGAGELPTALNTAPGELLPFRPAAAPGAGADGVRKRLLYVEDNRVNAMLFEAAMRLQSDVELRVAENGAQGLEIAAHWIPDVIALDANLPDTNGYELLMRLRQLPPLRETPAFMCSADAMPEDLQRARRAGFVGYWTKPIDIEQVLGDIETVCGEGAGPPS
ncbi:PAS domain-containing protein [Aquabacterium sp. A7-Y]|uniref:hybrid sensor histidine kinase/response regulator n=1 Tax=Aquabacterium sp. A7-Y TaxID=1349605 RepID=UPI00223CAD56|nr:PAS domain-containing hybrid sensor histidine kinase/response regulator [Aquabacterium sp. A7-Y]MCW7541718.1 PAS domain-containing protein [Aquabacterium sp. A7-Y]